MAITAAGGKSAAKVFTKARLVWNVATEFKEGAGDSAGGITQPSLRGGSVRAEISTERQVDLVGSDADQRVGSESGSAGETVCARKR